MVAQKIQIPMHTALGAPKFTLPQPRTVTFLSGLDFKPFPQSSPCQWWRFMILKYCVASVLIPWSRRLLHFCRDVDPNSYNHWMRHSRWRWTRSNWSKWIQRKGTVGNMFHLRRPHGDLQGSCQETGNIPEFVSSNIGSTNQQQTHLGKKLTCVLQLHIWHAYDITYAFYTESIISCTYFYTVIWIYVYIYILPYLDSILWQS